jgi:hypothetical protein
MTQTNRENAKHAKREEEEGVKRELTTDFPDFPDEKGWLAHA